MLTYPLEALSLFPATQEQVSVSRKCTAAQWNRGKTVGQYVQRDVIMDEHEHAVHDRLITWVLAPRDDPSTLDFMCSCETFRRDSIVIQSSSGAEDNRAEDVIGYGIASVYTPPSKRKHGYASRMMSLLHWVLAPHSALPPFPPSWGTPPAPAPSTGNARFSVLYSDVGSDFYNACGPDETPRSGWVVRGAEHTIWKVEQDGQSAADDNMWKWLRKNETVALYNEDTRFIKGEAASRLKDGVGFTFLPDKGVGLFNINRTMEFDGDSLTPNLRCEHWGVVREGTEDTLASTFATWTPDVRDNGLGLVITRLRVDRAGLAPLVGRLREAAHTIGAQTVEVWNLVDTLKEEAARTGGVTEVRHEHLPAFKWYGKESEEQVHWLYNEKWVTSLYHILWGIT
ncbi:hypothetical protein BXZ70DRAFT_1002512 [Cristinia sonorae]|uniref:LYC1 C-terminal domain-containing protein n=1 Tax=Cristinia sonorae TaxID=1940300 RepID=A0A8K0UFR9_9AGAR|nr:hypothetical protein BXZ70DRAFT_1002512 [Cristinia sonorae]